MENKQKSLGSRLNELSGGKSSTFLQKARERDLNKDWLKKSAYIAFQLMEALDANGMTQKDLATKLGVSQQQVGKWLQGQENMKLDTIAKLENALDIDIDTSRSSVEKLCCPEITIRLNTTDIIHYSVVNVQSKSKSQVKSEMSKGIDLHY